MKKALKTPPIKISTTWDLNKLFKNDDDPEIEADRKSVEQKSYAFINKWKKP